MFPKRNVRKNAQPILSRKDFRCDWSALRVDYRPSASYKVRSISASVQRLLLLQRFIKHRSKIFGGNHKAIFKLYRVVCCQTRFYQKPFDQRAPKIKVLAGPLDPQRRLLRDLRHIEGKCDGEISNWLEREEPNKRLRFRVSTCLRKQSCLHSLFCLLWLRRWGIAI